MLFHVAEVKNGIPDFRIFLFNHPHGISAMIEFREKPVRVNGKLLSKEGEAVPLVTGSYVVSDDAGNEVNLYVGDIVVANGLLIEITTNGDVPEFNFRPYMSGAGLGYEIEYRSVPITVNSVELNKKGSAVGRRYGLWYVNDNKGNSALVRVGRR